MNKFYLKLNCEKWIFVLIYLNFSLYKFLNQNQSKIPKIANGIVTPNMYPLSSVLVPGSVVFGFVVLLLLLVEALHETHLFVDSFQVYE